MTTRGVTYGYDDAGRLKSEVGKDGLAVNYDNAWSYDKVGNRIGTTAKTATVANPTTLSSTTTISSTFNANDWLTAQSSSTNGGTASTQSWSYDDNGAEKTHGYGTAAPQENGWGFDGALLGTGTQGTTSGGTSYQTDASGNRIGVTLNQGQTAQKTSKYLLDENTSYAQVLALWEPDVNDGGTSLLQARMAWGGGLAPLAMWRKGTDGTFKVFYPLTDGQESVRQLTDAAGLVTDSYYYDAWGNALAGGSGDTKNPFRYTGQMLDSSGKYFLRARYYDPSTGRFLSHDPLMGSDSDPVSMHRYLYASNDAVGFTDPSGEESLGELQSVMQNQLTLGFRAVNTAMNVYDRVNGLMSALDYANNIIRILRAVSGGSPAEIVANIQKEFLGNASASGLTNAFNTAFNILRNDWGQIAPAIEARIPEIADDVVLQMAYKSMDELRTVLRGAQNGTLEWVFGAPTAPPLYGQNRDKGTEVSVTKQLKINFALTGGRLFGFGYKTGGKQNLTTDFFRIDYWDVRSRLQGRPTVTPLHVHYHVIGDKDKHLPERTIWGR